MQYIKHKFLRRLKLFFKKEYFKIFYKGLFFNLSLTNFLRGYFYKKLLNFVNLSSSLKNRCFFNNSSKGLLKQYRMSRHVFKYFVNFGLISGMIRK